MSRFGRSPMSSGIRTDAQITLHDFRAAEQFAPASLQRDPSRLDHVCAVCNGEGHLRILL